MSFFKKLFGIKSPKESDVQLRKAEWKQLEEYGKELVEVELKKDEPIPAKPPSKRRRNVFKKPSLYSESAVYTIEGLHGYIERNEGSLLKVLSQEEIDVMYKDWFSKSSRSFNDFVWSLYNRAILANKIKDEYSEYGYKQNSEMWFYLRTASLYYGMGRFRFKENGNIKAANQFMRLGHEAQFNSYKHSARPDVAYEVYLVPHPRCEYAMSLDESYSFDEFLDKCGIALDGCNFNSGCGCTFGIIPLKK